ncbi:hypothetical protein SDRG_02728 [Saprolegnia diclina VS20]|uniref:Uncharacterized protein n=1 Tax=Saprolegnia diclina (strain VS20) TaxID=1156394 RepID=T0S4T3_SAPDV|nr:hypothetical protein SDRG_02728 [Saprolegnia diclina VS20]EQC40073.1 hypothetical protein SDRG_02728 [Saprolegnia diclina VS20]|eukprot:XP_008606547.1 hypothetical protein SDRG_02728 [Saprolegnia diclina VS20]
MLQSRASREHLVLRAETEQDDVPDLRTIGSGEYIDTAILSRLIVRMEMKMAWDLMLANNFGDVNTGDGTAGMALCDC